LNVTDPVGLAPPLTVAVSVKLPGAAIDEDEVFVVTANWALFTVKGSVPQALVAPRLLESPE
jgi:hypothetical protein